MNIAAVFIAYFSIKGTQFHPDSGAWRGQYNDMQLTVLVYVWCYSEIATVLVYV